MRCESNREGTGDFQKNTEMLAVRHLILRTQAEHKKDRQKFF